MRPMDCNTESKLSIIGYVKTAGFTPGGATGGTTGRGTDAMGCKTGWKESITGWVKMAE